MSVFIILEVITEFVMAIVWTNAVKDPLITLYVVLSTLLYCLPGIVSLCMMAKEMYNKRKTRNKKDDNAEDDNAEENADTKNKDKKKSITTLPLYFFIWLASYFAYLLIYAFSLHLY